MKDFAVYVRLWDQLKWKLSPKFEFIVNKSTTMRQLADQVHDFLAKEQPDLVFDAQLMDICRVLSIHKFNMLDLVDMEVVSPIFSIQA